jgi:cell division protein FtsA
VRYACALAQLATAEESIQVPSVGDRPPRRLARQALAEAVQNRYEEIFEMVQAELRRSGFEELVRAGMVLTGGAAKMEGVVELAEEMLHMPVRIGIPQYVTGLGEVVGNPVHATGVGLLLWGSQIEHPRRPASAPGRVGTFWSKVLEVVSRRVLTPRFGRSVLHAVWAIHNRAVVSRRKEMACLNWSRKWHRMRSSR